jgi:uncharacterized SAM-binding protein YcdF (DUF218 family)
MSRISESRVAPGSLERLVLLCIGLCMLFSLAPVADFDLDGLADSFATDGLLLNPVIPAIVILAFLLERLLPAGRIPSTSISSPATPPPKP